MPVLAISRVLNSDVVAQKKGWKDGYRLIDTVDKQTLDVSEDVVLEGFLEHRMRVANMSYYQGKAVANRGTASDGLEVELPVILVDTKGEKLVQAGIKGKDMVVVTNFYLSEEATNMYVLCDCFGRNIREVAAHSLEDRYRAGKAIIMNGVGKDTDRIGLDVKGIQTEHGEDWSWVRHKQVREYMKRSKILGVPMMWMCDLEGTDGVYLDLVGSGMNTNLRIPEYVEEIGEAAFTTDNCFKSIVLGQRVRVIRDMAFTDVQAGKITLNQGLLYIHEGVFGGAEIESPLVIPKSVRGIGYAAFEGMSCPQLVVKAVALNPKETDFSWAAALEDKVKSLVVTEDVAVKLINYFSTNKSDAMEHIDVNNIALKGNKLISERDDAEDYLAELLYENDSEFECGVEIID